ncbi:MAG: hypothetical protein CL908_18765 [Deltaproteobacteria bacterium]|nr:hypothetical protein [Deltaproteobacteria bacterium]
MDTRIVMGGEYCTANAPEAGTERACGVPPGAFKDAQIMGGGCPAAAERTHVTVKIVLAKRRNDETSPGRGNEHSQ